jgi:hypothetical protein
MLEALAAEPDVDQGHVSRIERRPTVLMIAIRRLVG